MPTFASAIAKLLQSQPITPFSRVALLLNEYNRVLECSDHPSVIAAVLLIIALVYDGTYVRVVARACVDVSVDTKRKC
jgi:hypothetical protein